MRTLVVKANSKENSSVGVYGNKNILSRYGGENSNEKIQIEAPTRDTTNNNELKYFYGIGVWSDKEITFFSENTDSIIINDAGSKLILKDSSAIKSYLLQHRSGLGKSILTIGAK